VSDQEKKPTNEDDVEGHALDQTSADEPDVEGHALDQTTADDPDVEGHMYNPDQVTVDQTNVD
jgi:hypothetical protein